jgi:uncharacterized protein (DUF58 family)
MPEEIVLLEEALRRKLDRMMLVANKVRTGAIKGDRRSKKRGTSIEFADYRNYAPGDDLRRMDWNVYARLRRPYIKLLEDEEDLAVHVVLDASASMAWPEEGDAPIEFNKLVYVRRLAAGLAYLALGSGDHLLITALGENGTQRFGPARGRAQNFAMLRYMRGIRAGGITDLNEALQEYALRISRPGLCFVISDMFSPSGFVDGLNALLGKGHEVMLLHVLSPDEITPPIAGDLRLVDVETAAVQEVSLDDSMRDLYARRVAAWREGIQAECRRRDAHYLPLRTDESWEKVLLFDLRRLGLVK